MSYNTLMDDKQQDAPWQFDGSQEVAPATPAQRSTHTVSWSASEFVAHQKGVGWYLLLALVTAAVSGIIFITTHDFIATGVVIFAAIAFGSFAARQPRVLQYQIDNDGLHIAEKLYHYENFKSFSVIEDDAIHLVMLMPMRRFMPALSIYYAPEDESKIINALADFLPFEPAQLDIIDRLMRRIRF